MSETKAFHQTHSGLVPKEELRVGRQTNPGRASAQALG